jgi:carboxypeptidase C (cathepsin A)
VRHANSPLLLLLLLPPLLCLCCQVSGHAVQFEQQQQQQRGKQQQQGKQGQLTFATVKGGGHMVPQTHPAEALSLLQLWLDGKL